MRYNEVFKYWFLINLLLITGCSLQDQVMDTIYFQNARINTTVTHMPVFLSTSDTTAGLIVKPRIFIGENQKYKGRIDGHSNVNSNGVFQIDTITTDGRKYFVESPNANFYTFKGDNYQIESSSFNFGFDADLRVLKGFLLTGGWNFGNAGNTELMNWRAGIALMQYQRPAGFRFDFGITGQQVNYDVQSLIIRTVNNSAEKQVIFLRDKGFQTNINYYFNLNLTFDDPDAVLGYFANLGYIQQTLLDVSPYEYDKDYEEYWFDFRDYQQTDLRNTMKSGFFTANAGLLLNFYNNVKLVGGVKYLREIADPGFIPQVVTPFVQLNFAL